MKNEINEKKFFIIEKTKYDYQHDNYSVHDNNMYDLTTAVKKLLALDTLNDKDHIIYHLVNTNDLWQKPKEEKPLVLKDEVKEDKEQMDIPF